MTTLYNPRPERWPQLDRRRFFVLVAIAGVLLVWLGWNVHLVQTRSAVRTWVADHNGWFNSDESILFHEQKERDAALSWLRRALGDQASVLIELPTKTVTIDEIHQIEAAFPEAHVCVGIPGGPESNLPLNENCVTLYNWPPEKSSTPAHDE